MRRDGNVIGQVVARLRYQRAWSQDDLVARLQVVGCNITRDILANIETRRSIATDRQIVFLAEVFRVPVGDLFPPRQSAPSGGVVGVSTQVATRRRSIGSCPDVSR